ncbi:MAG TPA: hypothetical protein VGI79_11415 [Caulobacteraceae bacterium]
MVAGRGVDRYVLQSPTHHRRHHVLDITEPVGHFGLTAVWDHLIGAWLGPDLWRDYCDF